MEGRTEALADMAASNTTHYGLAPFGSIPIKARRRPPPGQLLNGNYIR